MSAPGTPKASQAAITAVQEVLGCGLVVRDVPKTGLLRFLPAETCGIKGHSGSWTERGCPVAVAAADAAAPHNAADALREAADEAARRTEVPLARGTSAWLHERADRIEAGQ